jgi:hypothetical protein
VILAAISNLPATERPALESLLVLIDRREPIRATPSFP